VEGHQTWAGGHEDQSAQGAELGRLWGYPLPADYRGSGERRELPSGVRSGAPAGNAFWHIFGSQTHRTLPADRKMRFLASTMRTIDIFV